MKFKLGEVVREVSTAVAGKVLEINEKDKKYLVHFHDDETGMKWLEWKKEIAIF